MASPVKDVALVQQPSDVQLKIIELASNPNFSADTMQALIAMHERAESKAAEQAFNSAFAEMQAELPVIDKNGSIIVKQETRSKYAKWDHIQQILRPILQKYGFSLSFRNSFPQPGFIEVTAVLRHRGGHAEENPFRCKADDSGMKNDIQALGSGQSYAMRYATVGILNLQTSEKSMADDDGAATGRPQPPSGYEQFKAAMQDAAMEGYLDSAWKQAELIHRKYAAEHDKPWGREIKKANEQAQKGAK